MTSTLERLRIIIAKDYKLPLHRLAADSPLEELGIDSLGTVELLWNVEDEFKITLPPEPVAMLTLGDVVNYIDELVRVQSECATAVPLPAG
jgi:acyl carrier protein